MPISDLSVNIISQPESLLALEEEWKALYAVSPSASVPLRWEYLQAWWEIYGTVYADPGGGLRVLALRQEGRLVGVLPLYLGLPGPAPFRLRAAHFIASGEAEFEETCSDYLDLLYAPGMEEACVEALANVFNDPDLLPWDQLILNGFSGKSPLLKLQESLLSHGYKVEVTDLGGCYISNFEGGMEEYFNRLSSENRAQGRRLMRSAEKAGMVFEVAGDEKTADQYFDEMVELHRKRWAAEGKPGCFAPRHEAFHRHLTWLLTPRGDAVLARLSWEGEPYAVIHGYRVGNKLDIYQQGTLHVTTPVRSPGTAATLFLMQYLFDRGITILDHLAGVNSFKSRFSTEEHPLVRLTASRPSLRQSTWSAVNLGVRATRKSLQKIGKTKQATEVG